MHIVFAASECVPFVKTGGLADVIGALPREIAQQGHEVTVYLPLYRQVQTYLQTQPLLKSRKEVLRSLTIPFISYNRFVDIIDGGKRDGVQYYLVDCPELFDRESPYGTQSGPFSDNWERFGLLCRAVLEASKRLGVPDVFHVHDWETAMLPVYLRTVYYFDPLLRNAGTVLTVHNAGYQGKFPPETTERLLLSWEVFTMERLEYYGTFNFLKGGIVLCRCDHDSKPQIRGGDTDAGVWQRAGRCFPQAGRRPAGHPEWRGLQQVEPGDGRQYRRALFRRGPDRQGEVPPRPAARLWRTSPERTTPRFWALFPSSPRRKVLT